MPAARFDWQHYYVSISTAPPELVKAIAEMKLLKKARFTTTSARI